MNIEHVKGSKENREKRRHTRKAHLVAFVSSITLQRTQALVNHELYNTEHILNLVLSILLCLYL